MTPSRLIHKAKTDHAPEQSRPVIQPKLQVNAPGDRYEQEADAMAERVIRGLLQPTSIMRKAESGGGFTAPPGLSQLGRGGGSLLSPGTRSVMENAFSTDFSRVRVHTDGQAADMSRQIQAKAFTHGSDIYFSQGQYAPESTEGKRLLAHELTHTVQQGSVSSGLLQRRRVPDASDLGAALPTTFSMTSVEAELGMARVLSRAWGGLTAAQQAAVRTGTITLGLTRTDEESLRQALISADRTTLISFATAIRTAAPSLTLGDPLLIDTGPRAGTADAANIATLVTNANTIFTTIAGTTRDTDIGQVFGTSNISNAKTKYNNARIRMNHLHATNMILTDRSGYNAEVGLGGLTNPARISVSPGTMDHPGDNESVVTFIHESMHAGNSDVRDFGYIRQPSFTELEESVKLTNAAHFEVVPRRILGAGFAFTGQTFIPAGTTVGGITAPSLTPRQVAIRGASERFRQAWTIGLNLHNLLVGLFRTPGEWNTLDLATRFTGAASTARFSSTLPFWSKVENLTIHDRDAEINPTAGAAVRPITVIDIALSEGVIRKLSQGMRRVPQTEADALTFETANATASEITAAAANSDAERDLLIRLVIRVNLGSITGSVSRDESVVARMGTTNNLWSDILVIRSPASFP